MTNTLIILFGLICLIMSAAGRMKTLINLLAIQGIILFLIVFFSHEDRYNLDFLFLVFETLIVKTFLIPIFLRKILRDNSIFRDTEPYIPNFYSLVISSVLLFAGFAVSSLNIEYLGNITPLFFGVSISTIFISLFFITTKKKLLTHVVGFVMLENGIFLLSLSIAKEMPVIVNLGVLLDIFIAIFILGLLIGKIKTIFQDVDCCKLCNLKDCNCND